MRQEIKEAIELLEKANVCKIIPGTVIIEAEIYNQTLSKLREAPEPIRNQPCGCILCICDTEDRCLGCGAKMCEKHQKIGYLPKEEMVYSKAPEQPPAGEFTEKVRLSVQSKESVIAKVTDIKILALIGWIPQLCDRLDRAEAINKELLKACKAVSKTVGDFRPAEPTMILVEAAIAKAEKE